MEKTTKPLKILCITPQNTKTKTPETGFAELLCNRGHDVVLQVVGYDLYSVNIDRHMEIWQPDVIWCMMEYAIPTAYVYQRAYGIPVYAHMECVPPWRIGMETFEEWGYDYKADFKNVDIKNCTKMYVDLVKRFNMFDHRTISGERWRPTFEKVSDAPCDADVRYYTYDPINTTKYYQSNPIQKRQICTIARFTPIKRVHHIIRALAKIDKSVRPRYALIGYGDQQTYLQNLSKELGVDSYIDYYGTGADGVKQHVIQESMFMVQLASGMPVIEAAAYKKPTISYGTKHMKEVFGDMCEWVEINNIDALAEKITEWVQTPDIPKQKGITINEKLERGEYNIKPAKEFVTQIEHHLEQAIKKCKGDRK